MLNIERLKELRKALNTENWNAKTMIEVIAVLDEAIARQSATSEEVESALCLFGHCDEAKAWPGAYYPGNVKTAITALQAYQPEPPKGE